MVNALLCAGVCVPLGHERVPVYEQGEDDGGAVAAVTEPRPMADSAGGDGGV